MAAKSQNILRRHRSKKPMIIVFAILFVIVFLMVSYFYYRYLNYIYVHGAVSDLGGYIMAVSDTSEIKLSFAAALGNILWFNLTIWWVYISVIAIMFIYMTSQNRNDFKNMEHGSARWADDEEIKQFQKSTKGIPLAKDTYLPLDSSFAANLNEVVIGGSGAGKSFRKSKPDILQMNGSYVVTDPKGELYRDCAKVLKEHGYKVRVLNLVNINFSNSYNPFAYIRSEKDILKLVTVLITNTKGDGKSGDDFWQKAERLLYTALIGYLHYEAPENEQNFSTLIDMINSMETREDDEDYQNPVDLMFDALEKKNPDHFAVRQYRKFKLAAGKTAKSILISCGARLAVFDIAELREITSYDELELDTVGDRKTALFLIMSDTDSTFNFLIGMVYSQLFNLLCEKADDVYGGRLPVHVRCLIDEFANIGQIPNMEKLVATIRSREISACIILQAQSQLKALYKDSAETIVGNMDSLIFLGGKEQTTLKTMAETLGKETIDTYNTGESRGRDISHSLNYQKLGKELMSVDELSVMDGRKCILQLRGVRPFLSDKYDITRHPNYQYLSDANPKNAFSIERFLSTQLRPKPDEEYAVFEIDLQNEKPVGTEAH